MPSTSTFRGQAQGTSEIEEKRGGKTGKSGGTVTVQPYTPSTPATSKPLYSPLPVDISGTPAGVKPIVAGVEQAKPPSTSKPLYSPLPVDISGTPTGYNPAAGASVEATGIRGIEAIYGKAKGTPQQDPNTGAWYTPYPTVQEGTREIETKVGKPTTGRGPGTALDPSAIEDAIGGVRPRPADPWTRVDEATPLDPGILPVAPNPPPIGFPNGPTGPTPSQPSGGGTFAPAPAAAMDGPPDPGGMYWANMTLRSQGTQSPIEYQARMQPFLDTGDTLGVRNATPWTPLGVAGGR